jgi:hypothetical protein
LDRDEAVTGDEADVKCVRIVSDRDEAVTGG